MTKFSPGPWRECGKDRGGCTCGQVWSVTIHAPVAEAIVGKWGDHVAVMRRSSEDRRRKEPAIKLMEYGEIPAQIGKANARLIAASPDLYDMVVETVGLLIERCPEEQGTIQKAQMLLSQIDGNHKGD